VLSREVRDISLSHKAGAVVVGTYAQAERFVHINLKVLDAQNQLALAATDYGLSMDDNLKALFFKGRF
jgi:TolB-like protein